MFTKIKTNKTKIKYRFPRNISREENRLLICAHGFNLSTNLAPCNLKKNLLTVFSWENLAKRGNSLKITNFQILFSFEDNHIKQNKGCVQSVDWGRSFNLIFLKGKWNIWKYHDSFVCTNQKSILPLHLFNLNYYVKRRKITSSQKI